MNSHLHNNLIIEVSQHYFMFAVKNNITHQILYTKRYPIESLAPIEPQLDKIFEQEELLNASYAHILVLHNNNLNTLVPQSMFNPHNMAQYLQYSIKVYPSDSFEYDSITPINAANVYIPYANYNNALLDKVGEFDFEHIATPMIHYALQQHQPNGQEVFLFVAENSMNMVVLNQGNLLLYNSFDYQTKEDFIYYILFVFEQIDLDTNTTPLKLFGKIDANDPNYTMASKYINNVQLYNNAELCKKLSVDQQDLKNNFIALNQ